MPICAYEPCSKVFYFLLNTKTGKYVPVDADSMTTEEKQDILINKKTIFYDGLRHISHFKTCLDPDRFSKK